jgi:pimeloyl-ACP methyl ester carboxylesterase
MKRIFSLPTIGLLFALLIGNLIVKGQTLFTTEIKGKGKPMILIHGLTCTGDVWKETVAHYQGQYELHILTLAGFGSNAPAWKENFLSAVKDDLILYIKNKKLKKPVIMGHSMGGFIALWTAAEAPGVVDKVITVDGFPFMTVLMMPGSTAETAKPMALNMQNGMANQTREQFAERTRASLGMMITSPEKIDEVMLTAKNSDPKTQAQVMYEMLTTDLRPTVGKIDCPVLLMGTWIAYKSYGQTHEIAAAAFKDQTAAIKNVTVEITDTAKHFIFYDDAPWFFAKADAFLGGVK